MLTSVLGGGRARIAASVLVTLSTLALTTSPALAVQCTVSQAGGLVGLPNPILFATVFPVRADFTTIGSTFGNHKSGTTAAGRGGDLWILYPDGSLCNITREGGFGTAAVAQGASSIAVRDPHVHPDGTRALFSMVVGTGDAYWQVYEVTGLGQGQAVTLTKLAGQAEDYNNLTPIYGPDGRVLFTSDSPPDGRRHLYPMRDEYESSPTNSGLWALDPGTEELVILDHSPSGIFTPTVDSYGRVLVTRWDHLQSDQQIDNQFWQGLDYDSEEPGASSAPGTDIFPELVFGAAPPYNNHRFNHFFPWMMNADGTEQETLNHIGRHELHHYFGPNRDDDPNITDYTLVVSPHTPNTNDIENFFYIAEDPTTAGRYYGIEAPEFGTHGAGGVVRLEAPPTLPADQITVTYITHEATQNASASPGPEHSGLYRNPRPLSDGSLLAAHTFETRLEDADDPGIDYDFRIRRLSLSGDHFEAIDPSLTGAAGIVRHVTFGGVDYTGPFWEFSPVEVRVKAVPPVLNEPPLQQPESQVFADEGVDPEAFRAYLRDQGLALVVSRDVTTRDAADRQQPFNLQVPGGTAATIPEGGTVYDVSYLQFLQGDLVRGYVGYPDGRRTLARLMHEDIPNPPSTGDQGSVTLGPDGSMAAMVPAHRAMTWQLTDPQNEPVVRERYWITFQAGEIRVCASCHGLNSVDQVGAGVPMNEPEALRTLLQHWKAINTLFADGFESGNTAEWSSAFGGP